MTPKEKLHADVAELIRNHEYACSDFCAEESLATAIIDLIRERVSVVTPEMVMAHMRIGDGEQADYRILPDAEFWEMAATGDFTRMLNASALGEG